MIPRIRPYHGPDDFDLMLRILSESWRRAGSRSNATVGDLEWWTADDAELPSEGLAWLWLADETPVGWAWLEPPNSVDWHLRPGLERAPFLDAMLDSLEATARSARSARAAEQDGAGFPANEPVGTTLAWAMDDDSDAIQVLARRGYLSTETTRVHWIRTLPAAGGAAVEPGALPPGYRHGHTHWPDDLAARVEVHRSAFVQSTMTVERYRRLSSLPHYAAERDRVIVASDGTLAAFANAWYDSVALVGELEPVGTHQDHRRLGLARAVCLEAIRRLAAAGAREVLIFTGGSNIAANRLYESLGCIRAMTSRQYARPIDG